MIVTVGNTKGGIGKTTTINLAILRAAAGREVLLVDGDEQGSASPFAQLRSDRVSGNAYTSVGLYGAAFRTQVRQLEPKYGDIIVDVGGRDAGSLRAALTVSSVLLVPAQPRTSDVWAADPVTALVAEAREINPEFRALAFLNAADAQGKDNADARDALGEVPGINRRSWAPPSPAARTADPPEAAKRKPAMVRFDADLPSRVDRAAKRRGISRSAWIQYTLSQALDQEAAS